LKIKSLCGAVNESYTYITILEKEVNEMVGNRLADFRTEHGLSPDQMAGILFVCTEKYRELEANEYVPDETETAQIASLLNVTKDYLESGEYDLKDKAKGHSPLHKTSTGWTCTEKPCGWRQNCGGGKFYCPGKGCMKEQEEKR